MIINRIDQLLEDVNKLNEATEKLNFNVKFLKGSAVEDKTLEDEYKLSIQKNEEQSKAAKVLDGKDIMSKVEDKINDVEYELRREINDLEYDMKRKISAIEKGWGMDSKK
jgi:hypothetical protein